MNRKATTIGRCKELGIWSEVCEREDWNEASIEEVGWSDDTRIAVDGDLLEEKNE
ncbi:hypothetical protein IMZ31_23725 (plasmid) [Pontibacillus sp. ALD_SL1]|uniref:hypothetical protein n=1 Tax=Pontibacillus sp. ALD_SL1 TaxID=2777185 RepID=UPI001A977146|nr:hypothetical protein [Pontibacillus sp. ALD_SL1]QST02462.1 hypothetical protein IMZ31_23725 [Pontibacillus sp. ALD_SL1]